MGGGGGFGELFGVVVGGFLGVVGVCWWLGLPATPSFICPMSRLILKTSEDLCGRLAVD